MSKKNILLTVISLLVIFGILVSCKVSADSDTSENEKPISPISEAEEKNEKTDNLYGTKIEGEGIEEGAEIEIENEYLVPPNSGGETKIQTQVQPFIDAFTEKYPEAYIVKFRWEDVVLGQNYTYIIEGVEGNKKYIVKYLANPFSVLGEVERELNDLEFGENGIPTEKELNLDKLMSLNEIYDFSQEDGMERRVVQWIISYKQEFPILEITTIDGKNRTFIRAANAETGEILK